MRREGEEEGVSPSTETTGSFSAEQRREHDTVIQGSNTDVSLYSARSWLLPRVGITKLHCYCKHSVLCIGSTLLL